MTATMQAIRPSGPRWLRIGILRKGCLLEERLLPPEHSITVGTEEQATFTLKGDDLPQLCTLFEPIQGRYHLCLREGMAGRLALPTGVSSFAELRLQHRQGRGGVCRVRLEEEARGKVILGDTTLLFQFVAAPPRQSGPRLPASILGGGSRVDWPTTMVAALSFLLHFLAIGTAYADWLDPPEDPGLELQRVLELAQRLPPPPPITERPSEDVAAARPGPVRERPTAQGASHPGPPTGASNSRSKGPLSPGELSALGADLERLDFDTVGALGGLGKSTGAVLRGDEELPTGPLDGSARSGFGISDGLAGLRIGSKTGPVRADPGAGLAALGSTAASPEQEPEGKSRPQKGPAPKVQGGPTTAVGIVADAERVVAAMQPGMHACFQRSLSSHPDSGGTVRLQLRVGAAGEVLGVASQVSGNLPASVVSCVVARAQVAQFSPPKGGSAVVNASFTFVAQR